MDRELSATLHGYTTGLRRYALSIARDPTLADDLVQECMKRALTYIGTGHNIENMRAYLFTILNNVYADELSGRKRRDGWQVPIEDVANHLASLPNQIPRLEFRDLQRALAALPCEQRQVVLLIGVEGESYKSAAELIGIPVGTVMSRLNRGRKMLKRLLSDRENDPHAERRRNRRVSPTEAAARLRGRDAKMSPRNKMNAPPVAVLT
jgi:RNA polymerase sigma-70 factor (ECF subfamily)